MRFNKIFFVMCSFLFIFTLLLGKVFYYQVVRGEEIVKQATAMRSKEITLKKYPRGTIFDCNFLPLTDNYTSSALYGLPYEIIRSSPKNKSSKEILANFSAYLVEKAPSLNEQKIAQSLYAAMKKGDPLVRLAVDLTAEEVANINNSNLSGVVIAPVINRYDPTGLCRHILGYTTGNNVAIGVAGIEKIYEDILSSNHESPQLITVTDAKGSAIQGLMFKVRNNNSSNKGSVVLTIDKRIQEIVEKTMDKKVKQGVVVIIDIKSKELLAVANRPSYHPDYLPSIIENENSPLTNRAMSMYYPGSLFKILVAAAALEENIVTLDDKFFCEGSYKFTDKLSISCWKEEGHGELSFIDAFANSCNPAFIEIGLKIKKSKLQEYAHKFHIADENIAGWFQIKKPKSYINIKGSPAGIGNASLGQEGVMLTPINIANLIATIADDGKWGRPSLVKYTINQNGEKQVIDRGDLEQVISKNTAQKVQKLMEEVVLNGTGKTASLSSIKVAGKTATSQTGNYNENKEEILNTWFGGYIPADNPKWAIVVMVESGSSGAVNAAPVFKEIAKELLNLFSVLEL